jgi:hypothetical protein
MHFMSWTSSTPLVLQRDFGFSRYHPLFSVDGSRPYSTTLTVQWTGSGGVHPAWWPLLPIGLGLGLGASAILGLALTRFVTLCQVALRQPKVWAYG